MKHSDKRLSKGFVFGVMVELIGKSCQAQNHNFVLTFDALFSIYKRQTV